MALDNYEEGPISKALRYYQSRMVFIGGKYRRAMYIYCPTISYKAILSVDEVMLARNNIIGSLLNSSGVALFRLSRGNIPEGFGIALRKARMLLAKCLSAASFEAIARISTAKMAAGHHSIIFMKAAKILHHQHGVCKASRIIVVAENNGVQSAHLLK